MEPPPQQTACVLPAQQAKIYARAKQHLQELRQQGRLPQGRTQQIALGHPLRQAPGYNDSVFYSVVNYVDVATSSPAVQDYNCGNRTYDGHNGIDFGLPGFHWQRMGKQEVQVVAAAPGILLDKADGDADTLCNGCGCDGNYVVLRHSDNSLTAYFHLKKNTVIAKAIGQTVAQGELLGYVGSSGNATGPHLHFEVYSDADNPGPATLIEPFAGTCNNFNPTSWWASQEAYYVPANLKLRTHNPIPSFGCYSDEDVNEQSVFAPGDDLFLTLTLRDQLPGTFIHFAVYMPDSTEWYADSIPVSAFHPQPTHLLLFNLPPADPGVSGYWQAESRYAGKTLRKSFLVRDSVVSASSGDWDDPATWACNCIPQAADVVTVKAGHTVNVTPAMGLVECGKLVQAPGSMLNVTGQLKVNNK